jgi:hypothetical protein
LYLPTYPKKKKKKKKIEDMSAKREVKNEDIKILTILLNTSPSWMYIQGFVEEI